MEPNKELLLQNSSQYANSNFISNYDKRKTESAFIKANNKTQSDFRFGILDKFNENIPVNYILDINTLPTHLSLVFGFLAYSIVLSLLLYFTLTSYQQIRNEKFISLDLNAGECR